MALSRSVEGLAAPFFIAAALLTLAGGSKLADPQPTQGALESVGLPHRRSIVVILGVVEVALGALAIGVGGSITAIAVAASYLGFAAFVGAALRRGGAVASCGCFGKEDTPPTVGHVVLNIAAAAVAAGAAIAPVGSILDVIENQPALGLPFIGFVILGTWLAYLALALLPTLIPRPDAGEPAR